MDRSSKAVAVKAGVGALLVVVGLVAVFGVRVQDHVEPALIWMQEHVVAGALTFSALYSLCTGAPFYLVKSPDCLLFSLGLRIASASGFSRSLVKQSNCIPEEWSFGVKWEGYDCHLIYSHM
jgi:hypothetical protein